MKTLLVTPYFHPHVGGVEVYAANIARQLKASGWSVVIVTTDKGTQRHREFDGMRVYLLKPALTISNTPLALGWHRTLRAIIEAERPDVIYAHTPVPYLADIAQRAAKSVPFVLAYHNDLYKDSMVTKFAAWLVNLVLVKRTLRESTSIITTSQYYVAESPHLRGHEPKIAVVPPGVDLARFNPQVKVDPDLALQFANKRVILFVGSIGKAQQHKGLEFLIRAFALVRRELADTQLVVVGSGNALEYYRSQALTAGVAQDVIFTGYVDDSRLAQYYRLATVFAMPSLNRSEGFGMVYIEAGATGTPVIGTRVGGVPFAVQDGETGLLAEPGSVRSLYAALLEILNDQDLARRLGDAGAERAQAEFDWGTLGQRTAEILTQALTKRVADPR